MLDWSHCNICGTTTPHNKFVRDHDHNTGFIRGILCEQCNSHLGTYENINRSRSKKFRRWVREYETQIKAHLLCNTGILYDPEIPAKLGRQLALPAENKMFNGMRIKENK